MRRWYAVRCKARDEQRAEQHLRNQAYEVFHPLAKVRRRSRGRARMCVESLFPGYLFVQLDSQHSAWGPIRSTRGVIDLVKFGNVPAPLPESTVQAIRARLDDATGCVDLDADNARHKDQPVRIAEGPFAGQEGLFQARCGEDRVIVLLNIMQQAVRTTVPEQALEDI
jgi:transcriptional antiterminator RfaH